MAVLNPKITVSAQRKVSIGQGESIHQHDIASIRDEVNELKRLRNQIFGAIRALSSAAPVPAKGKRKLNQALISSAPPKEKEAAVNPEKQLQDLKTLAGEWIGYKGGLALPKAAVLCPPLSPRRFRYAAMIEEQLSNHSFSEQFMPYLPISYRKASSVL